MGSLAGSPVRAHEDWEISSIAFNSENSGLIIINDELSGETNRIKFHSVGCVSIIYYLVSHIHHNNGRNNKNQNIQGPQKGGNPSINR